MSAQKLYTNARTLRQKTKLSQREFSKKIGVEEKRYASWEQGRVQPDIDNIEAIAKAHKITIDQLLNEDLRFN